MKMIFYIAIFIVSLLFIGQIQVTFKPFAISLPYWHRSLGLFLIVVGLLVYNIGEQMRGYTYGYRDGINHVIDELEKRIESKK